MDEINESVREWISDYQKSRTKPSWSMKRILGNEGPFWTYALATQKIKKKEYLDPLFERLGIKRIVIGHSFNPKNPKIRELYNGAVINADTGISDAMGGELSIIEMTPKGIFYHHEGKITRLCDAYLRKLASQ